MNTKKPIYVVRPNLPPFEDFTKRMESVWQSGMLTNNGPLHQELERELCHYLDVPEVALFNNATIGLVAALDVLDLQGEVITTPFSFIATSHALLWNQLTPVFVDIDPESLNIDPEKIEAAITEKTSAILAVHCYGRPCDVEEIEAIARKHNLKVIYDAAHAFGIQHEGQSLLNYGDLSVLSFHATKVFNCFEGGAIICRDQAMKEKINRFKNFGIVDEETVDQTGLNGKMSEAHAAMGLSQLPHMADFLKAREQVDRLYREELASVEGIACPDISMIEGFNYAYFPIFVNGSSGRDRDALYDFLKKNDVIARRYFYPLLSEFPMYRDFPSSDLSAMPHAKEASRQVLCLPIYPDLPREDQLYVISLIKEFFGLS